jgi:release factor glutamine methyltransferase
VPITVTDLVARLRAAGCVFAEEEAALLRAEARTDAELDALVARCVAGEPLEQVLGWAEFYGLRVRLEPGVFVPRRRTELVVTVAVRLLPRDRLPVVVDLCCGTGAIGLAVAAGVPELELHAADLDPAAVRCAQRNLASTGQVHQGDLFDALPDCLRGRVDVLAVNTPYVPTDAIASMPPEARDHEARTALDGGPDGLALARRVAAEAAAWLVEGGSVVVETSEQQAPVLAGVFTGHGLTARVVTDDDVDATVVVGRRD